MYRNTAQLAVIDAMPGRAVAVATAAVPVPAENRRNGTRFRTVYRLAAVRANSRHGLARVRNISNGGMQLNTTLPILIGDRISVALNDAEVLTGRAVWTNGNECGVQFDSEIDSASVLRETAQAARDPRSRQPRLPANRKAVAVVANGLQPVRVCDLSQKGMKLAHKGQFSPGMPVKVILDSGISRRGIVRWSSDGYAGVLLTETFSPHELGRLDTL